MAENIYNHDSDLEFEATDKSQTQKILLGYRMEKIRVSRSMKDMKMTQKKYFTHRDMDSNKVPFHLNLSMSGNEYYSLRNVSMNVNSIKYMFCLFTNDEMGKVIII